jgi:hypothetical protein
MPQADLSGQVEQMPVTTGAQPQERRAGRANNAILRINETEQASEDLSSNLTAQNSITDPLLVSSIHSSSLICGIDSAAATCRTPTSNLTRPPSP